MSRYTLSKRKANVIDMYTLIFEELHKKYNISYEKLADMATKYELYSHIDVSYKIYNSMGNAGIIEDIEDFIKYFGGDFNAE